MRRGVILAVILVLSLLALGGGFLYWFKTQQEEVRRTRDIRAERMLRINVRLLQRQPGLEIIGKELESRCGRLIYSLDVRTASGEERRQYFDLESGEPPSPDWQARCLKLPESR